MDHNQQRVAHEADCVPADIAFDHTVRHKEMSRIIEYLAGGSERDAVLRNVTLVFTFIPFEG